METIDIQAKEWNDQKMGNSYFVAAVTLDFAKPTEKKIVIPFQYGTGNQYIEEVKKELNSNNIICCNDKVSLYTYCRTHKIRLRAAIQVNAKKVDLILLQNNFLD